MEEDFESLNPEKFLDKHTKTFQNSSAQIEDGLKLVGLVQDSEEHLKVLKFIPHLKSRTFQALDKTVKSLSCNVFVSPDELCVGDECMIAEPIITDDEREMFMSKTRPFNFYIQYPKRLLKMHIWTVFQDGVREGKMRGKKYALCIHGFGLDCSKHDWMKWVYDLYTREYNIIMVDLPGFGRSSGRDLNTLSWKHRSGEVIKTILSHFKARRVACFCDCGGAAVAVKLIAKSPKLFGKRHVLIRPTMGSFPKNLGTVLRENKIKLWVTWIVDADHPRCHSSFRNWTELDRKKMNVKLVVQNGYQKKRITYYATQYTPGVTRTGSGFNMFCFNMEYKKKILRFFDCKE